MGTAMKRKQQSQVELPGCEPDVAGALQRKADAPLKPRKLQEPCDLGLFSDENKQVDLTDQLGKPRAFSGGIESGGFPTAFAQANLEKLIRLGARSMPKPYSTDLRERAVEAVESGASRREVAEVFEVGVSSVIRWCRRWSETGSVEAKPSGGSTSPLEEHSEWLLTLVAKQPDLTLKEILAAMAKQGIGGSQSALQRFFDRHNVSFKKKSARGGAKASRCRSRPPTLDTRARLA